MRASGGHRRSSLPLSKAVQVELEQPTWVCATHAMSIHGNLEATGRNVMPKVALAVGFWG